MKRILQIAVTKVKRDEGVKRYFEPKARMIKGLHRLRTGQTEAQCRKVAAYFRNDTALDIAAQWVEDLRPNI